MDRVRIVHVPLGLDAAGRGMGRAETRDRLLPVVAQALGVELAVVPAAALLGAPPGAFAASFEGCRGVAWGGRIAFLPELRRVHARILAELESAGRPGALVVDGPEAVDECFSLGRMIPKFEAAGLPGSATRLVPLPEVAGPISEEEAKSLLERKLRDFPVEAWGVFVRTYYGTLKRSPLWHMAHSREQLISRATYLVSDLSKDQEIGGLAVRERLPILPLLLAQGQHVGFAEFRVFVAFGKPLFWAYHAELEGLRERLDDGDLARMGEIAARHAPSMQALSLRAGRVLDARFVVVDFAVLEDGRLAVIEANPAHGSGFGHLAALVGAHGRFLRALAGLGEASRDELDAALARAEIAPWGRDQVFGFF